MRAQKWVPRALVLSLTAILTATSVVTTPASAADRVASGSQPQSQEAPKELPDEVAAAQAARKFGKPVRVSSKTDELSEVIANPDGTSTFTTAARPQRARRGNDWVPVDTKLRKNPDGSITPVASTVDIRLGKDTAKPFVLASREGAEVGLSWPAPLPEPKLDGDTATYPEVLPGVDLRVKATDNGFAQLLVVKTAQAAQQPALRKITYGSHVKGGTLTEKDGRLELKDPTGKLRFAGNASQMWDSASRRAEMGVELTPGQLSVLPDQKFLTDPTTTFPVFIDPEYGWPATRAHHAVVQSGHHDAKNYDISWGDLSDLKAGLAPDASGISRSFVEMGTAWINDKAVHKATFRHRVINSFNCQNAGWTVLYTMHTGINRGTDWDHQPVWGPEVGRIGSVNNPRYCPTDGGHDMDITAWAQKASAEDWGTMTFGYRGSTENDNSAWRRLDLSPVIEVKYNSYPYKPAWPSMQNGQIPCVRGVENRLYVGTRTPRMRAGFGDPDGGMLTATFALHRGKDGDGNHMESYHIRDVPSGSYAEAAVRPGAITEDGLYTYAVIAGDGELLSPWHEGCEFVVDTVPPGVPKASSAEYPAGQPGGGIGVTGTFVLDPKGSTTSDNPTDDVVKFKYSFTDDGGDTPEKEVAAESELGGKAEIRYTPRLKGPLSLFVRSVDKAGNQSKIVKHEFFVLPGGNPVAQWKFDGSLTDTNGGNAFTAKGNPNLVSDGYADKAVGLNGSTDYLSRPAVFDSAKSFSVSAWAKLDDANWWRPVVSGGGTNTAFVLEYAGDLKKWIFGVRREDANLPLNHVTAIASPQIGVWTHLVGTYDAAAGKVVLYVDGVKQGETAADKSFTADQLMVGRKRVAGNDQDNFAGGVDELRAYDRTLNDAEVKALANQSVARAYYPLSENTGTTTKDSVTGRAGTLTGGASWDREDEYVSVKLDGTTGYVTAPTPAIRTDKSFSVTAFVNLPERDNLDHAVLSLLPANGSSPFYVIYNGWGTKGWLFGMSKVAGAAVWTKTPAATNDWVQLTAVYDAPNTEMRLYVNGQFIGRAAGVAGPAPVPATFEMGRLMADNTIFDYWKGGLDDVRVFAGALTDEEISRYAVRNP